MLYAYKVIDGKLSVYYVGGSTPAELQLTTDAGWTTYWTTDSRAHADAVRLSVRTKAPIS